MILLFMVMNAIMAVIHGSQITINQVERSLFHSQESERIDFTFDFQAGLHDYFYQASFPCKLQAQESLRIINNIKLALLNSELQIRIFVTNFTHINISIDCFHQNQTLLWNCDFLQSTFSSCPNEDCSLLYNKKTIPVINKMTHNDQILHNKLEVVITTPFLSSNAWLQFTRDLPNAYPNFENSLREHHFDNINITSNVEYHLSTGFFQPFLNQTTLNEAGQEGMINIEFEILESLPKYHLFLVSLNDVFILQNNSVCYSVPSSNSNNIQMTLCNQFKHRNRGFTTLHFHNLETLQQGQLIKLNISLVKLANKIGKEGIIKVSIIDLYSESIKTIYQNSQKVLEISNNITSDISSYLPPTIPHFLMETVLIDSYLSYDINLIDSLDHDDIIINEIIANTRQYLLLQFKLPNSLITDSHDDQLKIKFSNNYQILNCHLINFGFTQRNNKIKTSPLCEINKNEFLIENIQSIQRNKTISVILQMDVKDDSLYYQIEILQNQDILYLFKKQKDISKYPLRIQSIAYSKPSLLQSTTIEAFPSSHCDEESGEVLTFNIHCNLDDSSNLVRIIIYTNTYLTIHGFQPSCKIRVNNQLHICSCFFHPEHDFRNIIAIDLTHNVIQILKSIEEFQIIIEKSHYEPIISNNYNYIFDFYIVLLSDKISRFQKQFVAYKDKTIDSNMRSKIRYFNASNLITLDLSEIIHNYHGHHTSKHEEFRLRIAYPEGQQIDAYFFKQDYVQLKNLLEIHNIDIQTTKDHLYSIQFRQSENISISLDSIEFSEKPLFLTHHHEESFDHDVKRIKIIGKKYNQEYLDYQSKLELEQNRRNIFNQRIINSYLLEEDQILQTNNNYSLIVNEYNSYFSIRINCSFGEPTAINLFQLQLESYIIANYTPIVSFSSDQLYNNNSIKCAVDYDKFYLINCPLLKNKAKLNFLTGYIKIEKQTLLPIKYIKINVFNNQLLTMNLIFNEFNFLKDKFQILEALEVSQNYYLIKLSLKIKNNIELLNLTIVECHQYYQLYPPRIIFNLENSDSENIMIGVAAKENISNLTISFLGVQKYKKITKILNDCSVNYNLYSEYNNSEYKIINCQITISSCFKQLPYKCYKFKSRLFYNQKIMQLNDLIVDNEEFSLCGKDRSTFEIKNIVIYEDISQDVTIQIQNFQGELLFQKVIMLVTEFGATQLGAVNIHQEKQFYISNYFEHAYRFKIELPRNVISNEIQILLENEIELKDLKINGIDVHHQKINHGISAKINPINEFNVTLLLKHGLDAEDKKDLSLFLINDKSLYPFSLKHHEHHLHDYNKLIITDIQHNIYSLKKISNLKITFLYNTIEQHDILLIHFPEQYDLILLEQKIKGFKFVSKEFNHVYLAAQSNIQLLEISSLIVKDNITKTFKISIFRNQQLIAESNPATDPYDVPLFHQNLKTISLFTDDDKIIMLQGKMSKLLFFQDKFIRGSYRASIIENDCLYSVPQIIRIQNGERKSDSFTVINKCSLLPDQVIFILEEEKGAYILPVYENTIQFETVYEQEATIVVSLFNDFCLIPAFDLTLFDSLEIGSLKALKKMETKYFIIKNFPMEESLKLSGDGNVSVRINYSLQQLTSKFTIKVDPYNKGVYISVKGKVQFTQLQLLLNDELTQFSEQQEVYSVHNLIPQTKYILLVNIFLGETSIHKSNYTFQTSLVNRPFLVAIQLNESLTEQQQQILTSLISNYLGWSVNYQEQLLHNYSKFEELEYFTLSPQNFFENNNGFTSSLTDSMELYLNESLSKLLRSEHYNKYTLQVTELLKKHKIDPAFITFFNPRDQMDLVNNILLGKALEAQIQTTQLRLYFYNNLTKQSQTQFAHINGLHQFTYFLKLVSIYYADLKLPKFGSIISSGVIHHEPPKVSSFSPRRTGEKELRIYLHMDGKGVIYMIAEKHTNETRKPSPYQLSQGLNWKNQKPLGFAVGIQKWSFSNDVDMGFENLSVYDSENQIIQEFVFYYTTAYDIPSDPLLNEEVYESFDQVDKRQSQDEELIAGKLETIVMLIILYNL